MGRRRPAGQRVRMGRSRSGERSHLSPYLLVFFSRVTVPVRLSSRTQSPSRRRSMMCGIPTIASHRRAVRRLPTALHDQPTQPVPGGAGISLLCSGTEVDLRGEIVGANGGFLVAPGSCQKPLDCPAWRLDHERRALARGDIREAAAVVLPASCRTCDVRVIGILSIMTSAVDIARHLFVPSLESNLFRRLLTING